jgi:hypothetical protein
MAKTHFKEVSTAKLTIESQPGEAAGATTLGSTTIGTLALGSGNAVTASVATASTHKMAVVINGTTYYVLLTNV